MVLLKKSLIAALLAAFICGCFSMPTLIQNKKVNMPPRESGNPEFTVASIENYITKNYNELKSSLAKIIEIKIASPITEESFEDFIIDNYDKLMEFTINIMQVKFNLKVTQESIEDYVADNYDELMDMMLRIIKKN